MKLLIFSHFFAPGIGGVEKQVATLAAGLAGTAPAGAPSGVELTVVTNTVAPAGADLSFAFDVVRRPSLFRLCQLIRKADVLHVAGPSVLPLLISFILRKPTVIEHHGYQSICPNGLLLRQPERSLCPGHFQAKRYEKCLNCLASERSMLDGLKRLVLMIPRYLLSKTASANIAITKHVLARHGLPASRLIYYGVADHNYGIRPAPTARNRAGAFRFAFVGRFVPEKGIEVLLHAAKILSQQGLPFEVRLIGDGPERTSVEALIIKLNLAECVRITGFVKPGEEMTNSLRDIDAVVVPSVWEEAAGFSAIEQMIEGRLVIASAIGGLAEVVGDAGLLFPPSDVVALASVMGRVARDPVLVETVAARGRIRALEQFGIERMIEEHARLYFELAGDERSHSRRTESHPK
jgi:glycosyltransferase involved in cell wall biosynthesis